MEHFISKDDLKLAIRIIYDVASEGEEDTGFSIEKLVGCAKANKFITKELVHDSIVCAGASDAMASMIVRCLPGWLKSWKDYEEAKRVAGL